MKVRCGFSDRLLRGILCWVILFAESVKLSPSVKGSLRNHIGFWRNIGADPQTLKVLEFGYELPFFCKLRHIFT